MKKLGGAVAVAAFVVLLAGCSAPEPAPTVTVTARAAPAPTVTVTVTPEAIPSAAPSTPSAGGVDLRSDQGLCAADAEMTNLQLNDAIAVMLGYPGDRDARSYEQDDAIRDYKNAAFERACPARAS